MIVIGFWGWAYRVIRILLVLLAAVYVVAVVFGEWAFGFCRIIVSVRLDWK